MSFLSFPFAQTFSQLQAVWFLVPSVRKDSQLREGHRQERGKQTTTCRLENQEPHISGCPPKSEGTKERNAGRVSETDFSGFHLTGAAVAEMTAGPVSPPFHHCFQLTHCSS